MADKKWISGAIGKPGALHQQLGIPAGKPIPAATLAAAASKPGKLGKRARLAQTLNEMIDRLHRSFEEMRRFTADAAHDLRTPVTALRTEVEGCLMTDRTTDSRSITVACSGSRSLNWTPGCMRSRSSWTRRLAVLSGHNGVQV